MAHLHPRLLPTAPPPFSTHPTRVAPHSSLTLPYPQSRPPDDRFYPGKCTGATPSSSSIALPFLQTPRCILLMGGCPTCPNHKQATRSAAFRGMPMQSRCHISCHWCFVFHIDAKLETTDGCIIYLLPHTTAKPDKSLALPAAQELCRVDDDDGRITGPGQYYP